jgi:hypothetical protein
MTDMSHSMDMSTSLSLGGGSKSYADESRIDYDDEDGESESYVIPNFAHLPSFRTRPSSASSRAAGRAILKRDPLERIPVDTRRRSWRKLPVPNLDKTGSTHSVTSYAESSCDGDGNISTTSSQTFSVSLVSCPSIPTRIRFEWVEVRLCHQTIGDNPAVTYSPPISIDWKFDELSPVTVDEYEETRGDRIANSNNLFLSSMDRRRVLKNKGLFEDDIDRASEEAERARKERAMTNALLPAMKVEEVLQSTR